MLDELANGLDDAGEILAMAVEEGDEDTVAEVRQNLAVRAIYLS